MSHPNSEHSQTGTKGRKSTARPSVRPKTKARTPKKVEIPAVESSNLPPRKKKSEVLVLKHYRLRNVDVNQTEAVVVQRGADPNDVVRKQYERGVNVDTALGAPGEDGLFGLYPGRRLAELLQQDTNGLISFALNQGVVPTIIQEYRGIIQGLNDTLQGLRSQLTALPIAPSSEFSTTGLQLQQQHEFAVTEVADEAEDVLGMFFGDENTDGAGEAQSFSTS